ncbi:MAG: hypothetical protein II250_06785 [Agathobacter sp.]|nr:hypothetical protein [Agathobacter sp.]
MKKYVKFFTGMLMAFTLVAGILPSTQVKAETTKKTYTVTFRAGNVGNFNLNTSNISGENIEATENYIKFTVEKGESLSSTFDFISDDASLDAYFLNVTSSDNDVDYIDSGYRLKTVSEWAENAANATVKRNTEYVLDYAKLVNPVKYTICFVDVESGEQIAPSTIAYGNAEEEILCTPLNVSNYSTTDKAVTLVLSEEDSENVVTFQYTYTGEVETITKTITNVEPGETITETVINEVEVVEPGGATVVTPEPADDNQADNQVNDQDNNQVNDQDNNQVDIQDEQVPLADDQNNNDQNVADQDDNSDNNGQTVTIEDEETPLADGKEDLLGSYWTPILGGTALAIILISIAVVVIRKKKISHK